MNWLIFSLTAYFINALNAVIDKVLLKKSITNPLTYSFYVGILSIAAIVLIPFGFSLPTGSELAMDIGVGIFFVIALFAFFKALDEDEPSRVVTIIGGFTPVFISVISFFFLNEKLSPNELIAFSLLMTGGVLISIKRRGQNVHMNTQYDIRKLYNSLLAAILFGIFYVITRFAYLHQPFISSFIWTRIGSFLAAVIIILRPKNRRLIFDNAKKLDFKTSSLFLFNKASAGLAFLMINYAVSIENPSLIQALQGIQYIFVFFITLILASKFPYIIYEKQTPGLILQKIVSILLIGTGLIIISLNL